MPFSELSGHLRQAIERVYRNFELSVDMGEIHSIQVYVTGKARQPGEYHRQRPQHSGGCCLFCGGPSPAGPCATSSSNAMAR